MRYLILLAGIALVISSAQAEIYRWTDRDGGVHFTDNPDRIPASYIKNAQEVDATPTVLPSEQDQVYSQPNTPPSQELYGGKDEGWWRSSFKSVRDQINGIEESLPAKRDELVQLKRRWVISMGRTPKAGEATSIYNSPSNTDNNSSSSPKSDQATVIGNFSNKSALSTPGQHREAYYGKKAEIEGDEAMIAELKKRLSELDDKATRAGVPFGWRK